MLAGVGPAPRPIGQLLEGRDRDGLPVRLGQPATVTGVVTRIVFETGAGGAHALANVQDATGGLRLFTRSPQLLRGNQEGDRVRARGTLYHFRGVESLRLLWIERIGNAPLPAPRAVSVADLAGERYSGQLVRVEGDLLVPATIRNRREDVRLRDRTGEISVSIPPRRFRSFPFVEILAVINGYSRLLIEQADMPPAALELAAGHPGPVDALLADGVMPEMSGPELAGRLQQALRDREPGVV